jgi:hypothetical protein
MMHRAALGLVGVALAAVGIGCGAPARARVSGSATESASADPAAGAGADAVGAAAPAMISDEECVARGGKIVTESTYAHLRRHADPDVPPTPFSICHFPSPKNGLACGDERDCSGGHCFCTGELSGPDVLRRHPALESLDGTAGAGVCSDEPVASGAWFCMVSGGKIRFHGLIVD